MKKIGWFLGCGLLLSLFLTVSGRASAQLPTDTDLTRNWDIRAGFFLPEREGPRAAEGDVWFTIGAERAFFFYGRYQGTLSIDYYGSGNFYNVPLQINARGETQRFRYGVGAGIGIGHVPGEGKTGFDYNLLVGYTLYQGNNPVTGDIRYHFHSVSNGALNGWLFTIGYHF